MMADDSIYWFALRSVPLVGNVTCRRLIEHFGSPAQVLAASFDELAAVKGVNSATALSIRRFDGWKSAEASVKSLELSGARLLTLLHEDYPPLLKEIPDPPPSLYLKGSLGNLHTVVAVVGSRRASDYGISVTEKFSRELAEQGVTIVSGLAMGIDAAAHRGALQSQVIPWGCLAAA